MRDALRLLDQRRRLRAYRRRVAVDPGAAELREPLRRRQPALDHCGIRFEVELEAVCARPEAERLLLARRRPREVLGAVRQVVRAAVPFEDRRALAGDTEYRILAAGLGREQLIPADLVLLVTAHRRAEHVCEQLCAETDAEHRLLLAQRLLDRPELGLQMRQAMLVLDVHRSAEHDQAAIAFEARVRFRLTMEVVEAHAVTAGADQPVEHAERLGRDMLKHQNPWHRRQTIMTSPRERNRAATAGSATFRPRARSEPRAESRAESRADTGADSGADPAASGSTASLRRGRSAGGERAPIDHSESASTRIQPSCRDVRNNVP